MPELWRCFEFELNQPASSYLKATHPDLIKQIIKRHSNHLQYVSFKVRAQFKARAEQRQLGFDVSLKCFYLSVYVCLLRSGGQQQGVGRGSVRYSLPAGELLFKDPEAHLHSQAQLHGAVQGEQDQASPLELQVQSTLFTSQVVFRTDCFPPHALVNSLTSSPL